MDSLNQIADIIVGHAPVSAVLISFLVFTMVGWARVPPFLAYAFAFMLSFIYHAWLRRTVTAVDKDVLAGRQAAAAVVSTIVLATIYWIARTKLNFKVAPPKKPSKRR